MSKKKPRPIPQPARTLPGLVDAHTHLAATASFRAPAGPTSVAGLVERAAEAGVERICTVGDGLEEAREALEIAKAQPQVWAACAIHPTRAHELTAAAKEELRALIEHPRCVAVGETGLDAYWVQHEPESTATMEQQEEALRWHIDEAVRTGKALMIHNRDADEDLLRILDDAPTPRETILHCFSSPLEVAREAIDRGYVLSFCGNVTFPRNEELREAARIVPAGQYLVETDAPYLTPAPYRGTRNEPAFVGHTALCVAEARGADVENVIQEVSETFTRVYGLDS
ncbi:TatD family hydrolase [Corynebacterium uropygiale]|uniref:TatD family hydrolase n=1 Tax=Corynebacterium uropygiale TaxID=1775911 RepID=A0A9X1QNS0_9CORY|nr:TatD family hydrolase [Corynebacterium uropygiale]MCF4006792.1 TatD family hydrolase [Corynebacterium uropygiale]